MSELVEAWRINQRVNLRLIRAISDDGWRATLSTRGGRTVARQFAHLHTVRVWHLQRRARPLLGDLTAFATHDEPTRELLATTLDRSAAAIEAWIDAVRQGAGGVRTFKRGLTAMVAYFVAHESHHRGNILLTLKQCRHPVDRATQYAIWDWDRL